MTDPNSAPSLWRPKMIQLIAMGWFWFMVVGVSQPIADFIYGVPYVANSNSALYYAVMLLTYIMCTTFVPFKYFMPEWAAHVPALALASVLMLKYDSPLFVAATNTVWLFTATALARGHVFPWSPYVRICFVKELPKES